MATVIFIFDFSFSTLLDSYSVLLSSFDRPTVVKVTPINENKAKLKSILVIFSPVMKYERNIVKMGVKFKAILT